MANKTAEANLTAQNLSTAKQILADTTSDNEVGAQGVLQLTVSGLTSVGAQTLTLTAKSNGVTIGKSQTIPVVDGETSVAQAIGVSLMGAMTFHLVSDNLSDTSATVVAKLYNSQADAKFAQRSSYAQIG